ncbi:hypothetical protein QC823_15945 [Halomonas vilamensis]|uniref:KfrA N-terminal DNA-binding domain-containing protein n=1 Tax=Vreelandella vilamensis TaxID=531309 RepID=A0ABU1H9C0_9GAMM|nr:hypothetical protein [Halomonas vilamensis]MDR5900456.1 hypothetical protein [Halomonas vilamensis]
MQPVTHIRSDEARHIHATLVAALGTESVPNQWMVFMRTVREQLPDVLSKGRPSKKAIESSPIGALGFSTWHKMCEAPIEEGGLGLPWSTWRQWSRAWAVVQRYPALESAPLTAAEVNKLAADTQAAGEDMPTDIRGIEAFQERQKERREAARQETHVKLKERLAALEDDLAASREETIRKEGRLDEMGLHLQHIEQELADEKERRQRYQYQMVQLESQVKNLKERNEYLESEMLLHPQRGLIRWLRGLFSSK